jgi:hypothetical protein
VEEPRRQQRGKPRDDEAGLISLRSEGAKPARRRRRERGGAGPSHCPLTAWKAASFKRTTATRSPCRQILLATRPLRLLGPALHVPRLGSLLLLIPRLSLSHPCTKRKHLQLTFSLRSLDCSISLAPPPPPPGGGARAKGKPQWCCQRRCTGR